MSVDLAAFKDAFGELLKSKTIAGTGVGPDLPKNPPAEYVTYRMRGSVPWIGYHQGEGQRVHVICYGGNQEKAAKLYTQVRNVILPPATPAEGYYGQITVTSEDVSQTVNFSGATLNAGPNDLVDPYTNKPTVEAYFIVGYY